MSTALPNRAEVLAAVDLYLAAAYEGAACPAAVQRAVQELRDWPDDVYACPVFARNRRTDSSVQCLRLGNRFYPHMKLLIEPAPGNRGWLFRADTHDQHLCPPTDHPEYAAIAKMREENHRLATAIDRAWTEAGMETFATFLRRDLDRRKSRLTT